MPIRGMKIDFQNVLNDMPGGFFLYEAGAGEKIIYANPETVRIFGCESLEDFCRYVGNSFRGMVHPDDLDRVEQEIEEQINASPNQLDMVMYRIIRKDGEVRWIDDYGHLLHDDRWGDVFYVFVSDITERKKQEVAAVRQLQARERERDPLTGLYTRDAFNIHAAEILKQNPDVNYCILATDIENFRYINETYGSDRGNEILQSLADYRRCNLPGFELGGRIEGDRFAYLFRLDELSREELYEHTLEVCRKYGVSHLPVKYGLYKIEEIISVNAMCNRALLALDSVKGSYNETFAVYSDDLRMDWLMRQRITASADASLRDKQFLVYYQPKHDVQTGSISGAEALVRWIHPDFGFMNPGVFISVFEKNGFITKLDQYVLDEVCSTLTKWRQEGRRTVPVSINLSRRDLDHTGLAEELIAIVDSYALPHNLIHFEVTETSYTENPVQTVECVRALKEAGFLIELDDFGSGYSSLVALRKLPVDILKIDMSILQQDDTKEEHSIQEFIMELAGLMNMKTVQEGVETEEQLERLRKLKCDYVQGYYFAKPLPKWEFGEYLDNSAVS